MMKDIPGYDGKYKINESGVIINKNGHIMRSAVSNTGRLRTALELPGSTKRKNESIHRLVAMAFLDNPDNLPVVMHLDNDPLNNHVSNLKWGTQSENMRQAFDQRRKFPPNNRYMTKSLKKASQYELYNEDGDCVIFGDRRSLAEGIGYAEVSLKNMVGHERGITQGAYKGYKIRRLEGRRFLTNLNEYIDIDDNDCFPKHS